MFKSQLEELLQNRLDITEKLCLLRSNIKALKEKYEELVVEIKTTFNQRVDVRDPRYSNAEKRKTELEREIQENPITKELVRQINQEKLSLATAEKDEAIARLKERYLFKAIELYVAELSLKEKS